MKFAAFEICSANPTFKPISVLVLKAVLLFGVLSVTLFFPDAPICFIKCHIEPFPMSNAVKYTVSLIEPDLSSVKSFAFLMVLDKAFMGRFVITLSPQRAVIGAVNWRTMW